MLLIVKQIIVSPSAHQSGKMSFQNKHYCAVGFSLVCYNLRPLSMNKQYFICFALIAQCAILLYWQSSTSLDSIIAQIQFSARSLLGAGSNDNSSSAVGTVITTLTQSEDVYEGVSIDSNEVTTVSSSSSVKRSSTAVSQEFYDPTEVGSRFMPEYIDRPEAECKVPQLDPWDKEIRKYILHPRKIKCKTVQPYFSYIDNSNRLVLNKTEFVRWHLLDPIDYKCWYQPLDRATGSNDDAILKLKLKYIQVGEAHDIETDQVEVTCIYNNQTKKYENIHALVRKTKAKRPIRDSQLSVFLLTVDSTSLSMFRRSLPLTFEFLTKDMGFRLMRSYNRAGLNSLPNMGIVLTGKRNRNETEDMQDELYKGKAYRRTQYDEWPLIWKNFSSKGYVTSYQEEMPQWGLFHYLTGGFKQKPTNHSYRPWGLSMYYSKLEKISSGYCFGNTPKPYLFINLFERLLTTYKGFLSFVMAFISDLSHDFQEHIEMCDDYLLAFFKRAKKLNLFNNTAVIVMGDHGAFWGEIRNTVVGRIEENLPFYSIWFPDWFYRKYPHILENLKMNEMILSSHFDTYETLVDILNGNFDGSQRPLESRGLSQLYPIPASRTCRQAGVPYYYCACTSKLVSNLTTESMRDTAEGIVEKINKILYNDSDICATIQLANVTNAQELSLKDGQSDDENVQMSLLQISFSTYPCAAEFETFLVLNGTTKEPDLKRLEISNYRRTNLYGKQSACVAEKVKRIFCCCFSYMKTTKDEQYG